MTHANADAATSFEESAAEYDEILLHNIAGAERLIASIPDGDYRDVLDVGCGTGFASLAFARRFAPRRIVGVDPASAMLDVFRAKVAALEGVEVELHAADVMSMPVEDGAFDAVISSMAFHWFPDKPGAVSAMAAKLRPGGVLAVLAAGAGGEEAFREVLRSLDPPAPPHLDATFDFAQRDIPQIEEYLEAAGLEAIDVWIERRGRAVAPEAYLARMRAVASHVTAGMSPEEFADLDARINAATNAAAGPDGLFHYEFCKLNVIARKPA
jgi:ubiquinone/menaquinone biosynthesis C-methylase UbiE